MMVRGGGLRSHPIPKHVPGPAQERDAEARGKKDTWLKND